MGLEASVLIDAGSLLIAEGVY